MITSQDLLDELDQEAQITRRVLERVPADKFDWRPNSKSMTLGQLALHLASIPGTVAELATRSTFDVETQIPLPSTANVDQLLSAHDRSIARAKQLLGEMDDAMLSSPWRMVRGEQEIMTIPRKALLRSILLNQSYHHRGQLTVYLRQVGALIPAIYGASADENPLASK